MYVNNNDKENRTDDDHPSLNVREFGYAKTCNIPDNFYRLLRNGELPEWHCIRCQQGNAYETTRDLKTLSQIFVNLTGTTETVEAQRIRTVAEVGN
jgi:hypothetical protein